jgi:hypothetical protein
MNRTETHCTLGSCLVDVYEGDMPCMYVQVMPRGQNACVRVDIVDGTISVYDGGALVHRARLTPTKEPRP